MKILAAPTKIVRATVYAARAEEILAQAPELGHGIMRHVGLLLPASPNIYVVPGPMPDGLKADALDFSGDQTFRMASMPTGYPVWFWLTNDQNLVGVASVGLAQLSIIVEHWRIE